MEGGVSMSLAIRASFNPVYTAGYAAAHKTAARSKVAQGTPVSPVPKTYSNEQTERKHKTLQEMSEELLNSLKIMYGNSSRNAKYLNPRDFLAMLNPDEAAKKAQEEAAKQKEALQKADSTDESNNGSNKENAVSNTQNANKAVKNTDTATKNINVENKTGEKEAGPLANSKEAGKTEDDRPARVFYDEKYAADDVNKDGRISPSECSTCKNRMYKDGSDEGDVSFKAPGHISPQASASVVASHEHEHVANAFQKANEEGVELLSVSVSLEKDICPECGTAYTAGGKTRTSFSIEKDA